jgi:alpha-D-ribose 1-methylphosphonate 5-triphosphate synthase subunit PhnH
MSATASGQHPAMPAAGFADLAPGFRDPVHDAQATFRAILDALAHPGRIVERPVALAGSAPAPLGDAAAAIALTLCDIDTPIWLDPGLAGCADYLRFHCGAPLSAAPGDAHFAFVSDPRNLPALDAFALGSDEYPDRSTTLIVEVAGLREGEGRTLSGPGIAGSARLAVAGLPDGFWRDRDELAVLMPRGLDVIFTCGPRLAVVPRTTLTI